jgi:hypothetical protein
MGDRRDNDTLQTAWSGLFDIQNSSDSSKVIYRDIVLSTNPFPCIGSQGITTRRPWRSFGSRSKLTVVRDVSLDSVSFRS